MNLVIEYRSIESLTPYANNARTHSAAQVEQIAGSIKEFGFTSPILVDGDNGIIAGHGRFAAARLMGLKTVPTIELNDLTDGQKRAYIIADNRLALNSGWDKDMLALELRDLQGMNYDLKLTGFEQVVDSLKAPTEFQVRALEDGADQSPVISKEGFAAEMARSDTEGALPIVPMYGEHHNAFIILCDNAIDEAWLRNNLGLGQIMASYKDAKIQRGNVLTVEEYRKRIGA